MDIPDVPDLPRMRAERVAKLQDQLAATGVDAAILLTTAAVAYAAGAAGPACDAGRAALLRPVVVVVAGDPTPHVFTPYPDDVPGELAHDHVHPALYPELDEGIAGMRDAFGALLTGPARVAVDDITAPLAAALDGACPAAEIVDAGTILGPAKITKTPDELSCIRIAQRINEQAMVDVLARLHPGVRQNELTATFLRRIFELGASANGIDPIWQAMAPTRAAGPWTLNRDLAFPTPSSDDFLRHGDVVWVDAGITYEGYASDFGRTWLVDREPRPNARQDQQFLRWRTVVDAVLDICKPGVTALELGRAAIAANDGVKPWLDHFYLAHGLGTAPAEMPFVGTDLGEAFDDALVMQPGMVLVLEPVIWDDGAAGYRAEDLIAFTDDGWAPLSGSAYDPYVIPT